MRTRWILIISLLSLALGSCGGSAAVEDSPTPTPTDKNIVSPTTSVAATIATSTVIETGVWKTYHNTQIGYSADYPADWAVNESVGINGELITTFMAPSDGQGVAVNVLNSEASVEEILDMPNTRCQQVTISGLPAQRCFDTLNFNFSTTFIDQGKQYTIVSFGKNPDENIYQHFLENFSLTR